MPSANAAAPTSAALHARAPLPASVALIKRLFRQLAVFIDACSASERASHLLLGRDAMARMRPSAK